VNRLGENKMSWKSYLIVGFCFVFGFLLMLTNSLVGVVIGFILVVWGAVFFLVSYSVGFREMVFGIIGVRRARISPPLGATNSVQQAMVAYSDLARVVDILESSRLPSKLGDDPENEATAWASEQLKDEFPFRKKQQHYIEVGDIGIEVRLPKAEDMVTLMEQTSVYLTRFKHVVALMINYYGISPGLIQGFKKDIEQKHGDKVTVIDRPWR